ncbi:MAG: iron-sulfur cluster-binding protein [Planctomycetota bacterium]|nr:MAG: iron-sulfur cluster-binding protein [Planctomycetota bacterium]
MATPLPPGRNAAQRIGRRAVLLAGGLAAVGAAGWRLARGAAPRRASVFIARSQRYDSDLVKTISDGLAACGLKAEHLRGKRVLLKPNLVEPNRAIPHMTTHPAVILAAAEAFRRYGARVTVGEAPGHVRDTELALDESGVGEALRDGELQFADLNYQDVAWRPNAGRISPLKGLFLPRAVVEADYVVSMPKLKTHHWVGVTASMKNLYGVLPGIKYGWPKNVLHHAGIPETVADICSTVPRALAIIDAIDCMEGDGPILGSIKPMGLLLIGANLPAVDATAARIMGLEPARVSYLKLAHGRLGPLDERMISQRGERWPSVASPFKMLPYAHLQQLRADSGSPPA